MQAQIDLSQEYGIDGFIFDTYVGVKEGKQTKEKRNTVRSHGQNHGRTGAFRTKKAGKAQKTHCPGSFRGGGSKPFLFWSLLFCGSQEQCKL